MEYFAKLDSNNNVLEVFPVSREDTTDSNGEVVEQIGIDFLENLFGYTLWKRTSQTGEFRKTYAGIGMKYDTDADGFYSPEQPFPSWTLNKDTLEWEAPVPYPNDGEKYEWIEVSQSWAKVRPVGLVDGTE